MQLFHLANRINETEINEEINPYLPELEKILQNSSKEELIKKFFSVEFSRFHNYYKGASKIGVKEGDHHDEKSGGETIRYFINVGAKDGFDWKSLKDFLRDTLDLDQDGVSRVDVKDSFSFFNTATSEKDKVFAIFENSELDGRKIQVETTQDRGSRGGKKKGKKEFSGKKGVGKREGAWDKKPSQRKQKSKNKGSRTSNIKSSIDRRRRKK